MICVKLLPSMNRNVTILIIILTIVLLSFYLVWLRGKFQVRELQSPSPTTMLSPSPSPEVTLTSTPQATPSASPSVKPPSSPKSSTPSGKTVR